MASEHRPIFIMSRELGCGRVVVFFTPQEVEEQPRMEEQDPISPAQGSRKNHEGR